MFSAAMARPIRFASDIMPAQSELGGTCNGQDGGTSGEEKSLDDLEQFSRHPSGTHPA